MKLNKSIIAVVIAGSFSSAHAQLANTSGFDGFISGAFGTSGSKFDGGDAELLGIGGNSRNPTSELRASVAYTDPSGFGVQLDQVYSRSKLSFSATDLSLETKVNTTDSAAHFFYRGKSGLVGAFLQQRRYDFTYSTSDGSEDQILNVLTNGVVKPRNLFGLEGQTFFGDLELSAQVGRQQQDYRQFSNLTLKSSGNLGSISVNYFLHDNWKVGLRAGESRLKSNFIEDVSLESRARSYGLQTEYRFPSNPVSVFAKYDYIQNSTTNDIAGFKFRDDRFLIGVKVTFGSGSLKSQATGGASLNPVRPDEFSWTGLSPIP